MLQPNNTYSDSKKSLTPTRGNAHPPLTKNTYSSTQQKYPQPQNIYIPNKKRVHAHLQNAPTPTRTRLQAYRKTLTLHQRKRLRLIPVQSSRPTHKTLHPRPNTSTPASQTLTLPPITHPPAQNSYSLIPKHLLPNP